MQVKFYEEIDDSLLRFAVIISTYHGKWVYCKHKERSTYEIPGGHREEGEAIFETAKRELYEETGAIEYRITPVCVYSVIRTDAETGVSEESFGMLYYADIQKFETELHNEIEKIEFFAEMPSSLTYPLIQPRLLEKYLSWRKNEV